ncbi:MAG TPA: carboxylating nicotinate-nucleotide diphosphorylase [Gammaproteobacteria bacterium]|jgi:nicotinate-nucleotide pyrophosphorylase (carboxylating)|nr:carboxylating nicotinate-nucleotide diphosphorylase [Gammaproteobacteria bacterium]
MKNPLFEDLSASVSFALKEDIGSGDVTAGLIDSTAVASANILLREDAIICGQPWFDETFRQLDDSITVDWKIEEGSQQSAETVICVIHGNARHLLTAERTAINFLQTLSGTATVVRQYADLLEGTNATILDTRKTLPGLRLAQKYAVPFGGGENHRVGLYDRVLIKENHIAASGSISQAVAIAKQQQPDLKIEVETESLDEFRIALKTDADIIMLDNFSLQDMATAVKENKTEKSLEASGNVSLETVRDIAETGVDYISCGALTKDVKSIDFSMRFIDAMK